MEPALRVNEDENASDNVLKVISSLTNPGIHLFSLHINYPPCTSPCILQSCPSTSHLYFSVCLVAGLSREEAYCTPAANLMPLMKQSGSKTCKLGFIRWKVCFALTLSWFWCQTYLHCLILSFSPLSFSFHHQNFSYKFSRNRLKCSSFFVIVSGLPEIALSTASRYIDASAFPRRINRPRMPISCLPALWQLPLWDYLTRRMATWNTSTILLCWTSRVHTFPDPRPPLDFSLVQKTYRISTPVFLHILSKRSLPIPVLK